MQCHAFPCMFWSTDAQSRSNRYAWTGDSRLISRATSLQCKKRASQSGDVPAEVFQNLCCMLAIKQDWQWRIMYLGTALPNKTSRWKCSVIQPLLPSSNCLSFSFHTYLLNTFSATKWNCVLLSLFIRDALCIVVFMIFWWNEYVNYNII